MDLWTILLIAIVACVAYLAGRVLSAVQFRKRERAIREDAAKRSRAVIGGQFSEQMAPYLPGFPYQPTEVKFLGKPVDFVVFKGLDGKQVERVVFLEVKSGKSRLSPVERSLKSAVDGGKVSYETYQVPDEVTR